MPDRAAIFDLDGTLITFKFNALGTKRALLSELRTMGVDTEGLTETTSTQKILDTARERAAPGAEGFEPLRRRLYDVIDGFEVQTIQETSLFPGTRDALERLGSAGVLLALLTNSGRKATDYILGKTGLSGVFSFVLTRDDVESMKPSPEGLKKALSMLPKGVSEVYYVGDSPYDIAAATLAGVKVISVPTGNYTEKVLKEEGADYVVGSIDAVPGILGL